MRRFLGIPREPEFSPGRVEDDFAILASVAAELRRRDHVVELCTADADRWPEPTRGTAVFTMCQGSDALQTLQRWEAGGISIVNRPEAILNCQRHRTLPRLAAAGVDFPESLLLETTPHRTLPAWTAAGAWIKRGDVHAMAAADVVFVEGCEPAQHALRGLRQRGIRHAVLQRHVAGMVVKFYAVRGGFFHCVPSADAPLPAADILQKISLLGARAAAALGVEVYGGDCIIDVNGGLHLIDLNDWPSYLRCRAEAATGIAAYLHAREAASQR